MNNSIGTEIAFDKIQHPFMINKKKNKTQQSGSRGNIPESDTDYIQTHS